VLPDPCERKLSVSDPDHRPAPVAFVFPFGPPGDSQQAGDPGHDAGKRAAALDFHRVRPDGLLGVQRASAQEARVEAAKIRLLPGYGFIRSAPAEWDTPLRKCGDPPCRRSGPNPSQESIAAKLSEFGHAAGMAGRGGRRPARLRGPASVTSGAFPEHRPRGSEELSLEEAGSHAHDRPAGS